MNRGMKHMDCRNYVALDVVKGICHRTKELVFADDDHCEHYVQTQKCKFCVHFAPSGQYQGACRVTPNQPMTYPDLITVTCDKFVAAEVEGA